MTALLPGPAIELEICLAVGQQENAGRWDAGRWGATVWAQPDTALGDWVDVTCDVELPFDMHAGTDRTDGVVTRWEAATVALTFHGARYNPRSGPWAGLLGPGLPLRIRWREIGAADWQPGFMGYVDDDGFTWRQPPGRVPFAEVAASDGIRIFNAAELMKRPVIEGAGESAAERVQRIADAVVWPDDLREIEPGGVAVRGTDMAGNAWSALLLIADTDLAHMWIDAAGALRYVPQGRVRPQPDPVAIVTCVPGDGDGIPAMRPVTIVGQQPTVLRNVANIQRSVLQGEPDAPIATLTDERSIARYLRRPYSRTDLMHTEDVWSERVAQAVLTGAAWPSFAPEAIELTSRESHAAGVLLLALDPSLTIQVRDLDGSLWTCQPAGWRVTIDAGEIAGSVSLVDVSQYVGAGWDAAVWDQSRWSY